MFLLWLNIRRFYPHRSGLLHWHWDKRHQPCKIWANGLHQTRKMGHWNGKVVRMTALIFTGDVEDKLQGLQWISRLSTWRPFRFCGGYNHNKTKHSRKTVCISYGVCCTSWDCVFCGLRFSAVATTKNLHHSSLVIEIFVSSVQTQANYIAPCLV